MTSEHERDAIENAQDAAAAAVTRTVMRYVKHRIVRHPDCEGFEAECLSCGWTATPSADGADIDMKCIKHTGRTGHGGFLHRCTSLAVVMRVE